METNSPNQTTNLLACRLGHTKRIEWCLTGNSPEDHSGFQGFGTWITKEGTIKRERGYTGIKDSCYYSQIILEPLRITSTTNDFIRMLSRVVENVDEEKCNKSGYFVGRPLFQKCWNYHQTPYCSQRKMKDGRNYPLLLSDHLLYGKQWGCWLIFIYLKNK